MIVNLSVKGVPEAWAERLRRRAESNHRSLQGELMAILERAAHEEAGAATWPELPGNASSHSGSAAGRSAGGASGRTLQAHRRGSRSVEEIGAAHRARHLEPFRDVPRAVDILRQERDAR